MDPGEHRNVYYLEDSMPVFRQDKINTPSMLFEALSKRGIEALVIPHHSPLAVAYTNWNEHDPRFEPVVEICSLWGVFEYFGNPHYCRATDSLPGNFYRDLLKRGFKLGAIASSDSHINNPGVYRDPDLRCVFKREIKQDKNPLSIKLPKIRLEGGFPLNPINPCYAGVYAEELTREAIFEAFKKRRVFATAGGKILIGLMVNERFMGGELTLEKTESVRIEGWAEGTDRIERIELIKNNRVIHVEPADRREVRFHFEDERINERYNYYYLRLIQVDGKMAWSSPVWVTCLDKPDLSIHLTSTSEKFPKSQVDEARRLILSRGRTYEGLAILTEREDSCKFKVRVLFRRGVRGRWCSGKIRIYNYIRYSALPFNFSPHRIDDVSDLFTDDGYGTLEWFVNLSEEFKGLSLYVVSPIDEVPKIEVKALIDDSLPFEKTILNGEIIRPHENGKVVLNEEHFRRL